MHITIQKFSGLTTSAWSQIIYFQASASRGSFILWRTFTRTTRTANFLRTCGGVRRPFLFAGDAPQPVVTLFGATSQLRLRDQLLVVARRPAVRQHVAVGACTLHTVGAVTRN